jgi:hypothetical protein
MQNSLYFLIHVRQIMCVVVRNNQVALVCDKHYREQQILVVVIVILKIYFVLSVSI